MINITMAVPKNQQQLGRYPVDITFIVHSPQGYLMGSEVSIALMKLTQVEFSYYMGFPVLQIAERKSYRFSKHYYYNIFHLNVQHSDLSYLTFVPMVAETMS